MFEWWGEIYLSFVPETSRMVGNTSYVVWVRLRVLIGEFLFQIFRSLETSGDMYQDTEAFCH